MSDTVIPRVILFAAMALVVIGVLNLQRAYEKSRAAAEQVRPEASEGAIPYDAYASRIFGPLWDKGSLSRI